MKVEFRIERLQQNHSYDPKYEVFAPIGYRFVDGSHSHMAGNMKDVKEEMQCAIEECTEDCNCKEES